MVRCRTFDRHFPSKRSGRGGFFWQKAATAPNDVGGKSWFFVYFFLSHRVVELSLDRTDQPELSGGATLLLGSHIDSHDSPPEVETRYHFHSKIRSVVLWYLRFGDCYVNPF